MRLLSPPFAALVAAFCLSAQSLAGVVLRVDFNDTDFAADTAPGFTAYTLGEETLSLPPFTLDVNPAAGATLDDAARATPADGGALTLAALYRDCVFAAGDTTANFYRVGLDAVIGGLTAGKRYALTVWSFDSGSTGARTSDWSVLGLVGPQFAANNYSFDGAAPPSNDTANSFSVTAYADIDGRLTLRGRSAAQSATNGVFLNGLSVDELASAAVTPETVLALDFNDRSFAGAAFTQAGFSEFILDGTTTVQTTASRSYPGGLTATLTGSGLTVDDRERGGAPGNSGAFTDSTLLRDFIFASNGAVGTGLDVTVGGLTPNATYLLEVWSFDAASAGIPQPRTSDWTANGAMLWDDYVFNGANAPSTNGDYKMTGAFTANGAGQLVISGRFVVNGPAVFLNALRISALAPAPVFDLGSPILAEFMAENSDGITDADGDTSDWIEIWNSTPDVIDFGGWHLTDDPALKTKWTFPAGTVVGAQARLIVWASGKDRRSNPAQLHTNFALNKAAGGYLALVKPNGADLATEFANLPAQRADISYGLAGFALPLTKGYFQLPTPGARNGSSVPGFVADTTFFPDRGFYTAPGSVQIACATPGAAIHYTTDGSEPTTASPAYPGGAGIPITTTTILRARAFLAPLAPTNVDTHSYVFNAHVQNQPANPPGWPANWGYNADVDANDGALTGIVPADYEMDPNVVGSTLAEYGVTDAMNALPVLSIALPPTDFLSAGAGIYQNPQSTGDAWERACSLELLELDGGGFHTNAGIRVHGNASRRPFRMQKHSFRVAFRSAYGDGKLNYKLFADTKVDSFNKLVLHAFFTDGWGLVSWADNRYRPHTALSFRDGFVKESFADMGHARVSGRHAHVLINGLYWGIYRIGERVDEVWASDHLGGREADWDIIAPDTTFAAQVKAGSATAWDNLFTLVNTPDLTVPANYAAVAALMDLTSFVDFYLLHIHADSEDWPHHNGYAVRNRALPGARFQFVAWDQEIAFDPLVLVDRFSPGAPNTAGNATAPLTFGVLYQKLRVNSEFRLLFADRAHRHLHNGGALSLPVEQARWQGFANRLDKAIVAESARWGDTADATPYGNAVLPANATLKRETHWLPQVNAVKNSHFPGLHSNANAYATIPELRSQSPRLYPLTEPPAFAQHGGNVPANYALTVTAPAGQVFYTLDGSDPRTAYTGAAQGALYAGPVTLVQTATVKARARNGAEWSALTEAQFIVGIAASAAHLVVTELHYHPPVSEEHEFIELANRSAETVDLTSVHFTEGLTFTFPEGRLLAPGARILVVRNVDAFTAQFGAGLPVAGAYVGALDNNGEELALAAADDTEIFRFTYNDAAPWPTAPDGEGRSLVLRSFNAAPSSPANWRSSVAVHGSPGASDGVGFTGSPMADLDLDGLPALIEHAFGTSDAISSAAARPIVAVETFDLGAGPQPFLTFTAPRNLAADDTVLTAEISSDLAAWQSGAGAVVFLGEQLVGGSAALKWRAAEPRTGAAPRQFFRARATLTP